MPGVGKVLGSLQTQNKSRITDFKVVDSGAVPNQIHTLCHVSKVTPNTGAKQWRCSICKFANPTYEEPEEGAEESKTQELVKMCKRCREPK